jgi:hypothetical protein
MEMELREHWEALNPDPRLGHTSISGSPWQNGIPIWFRQSHLAVDAMSAGQRPTGLGNIDCRVL